MLNKTKKITRLFIVLAVLGAMLCSIPSQASNFFSYTYNSEAQAVAAPDAATAVRNITGASIGTSSFNMPQDLFLFNNEMYIVDTGNSRIVVTDMKFSSSRVISGFVNNGKTEKFDHPEGICVTDDGLFICDTKKGRVVHLDKTGALKLIIQDPQDESFDDDFVFSPSKVYVDQYDRIFIISKGYNMGLMQFDAEGNFLKSIGAPEVTLSLAEQIWRKFYTKEQRARTSDSVPTEYSNITINDEGFIFVTSESTDEDIDALRMLNSKGTDVITRIGEPSGDMVTETSTGSKTYSGASAIVDVCEVGPNGNRAILDRKRSRVFVYNENSELLYMFGGPGSFNGGMTVPSSMVYDSDKFYISDYSKNCISVYELTDYGKMFSDIAQAKKDIDFETEEKLWKEILDKNENCTLALSGLGNAAYKHQDMKTAMNYYKLAEDRTNYSKAFSFVRREWIDNNVVIILLVVAALIAAFWAFGKLKQKYVVNAPKDSLLSKFNYSSYVSSHPLDGFWVLKREKRGSYGIAVFWLAATIVMMVVSNLFNGFIFNPNNMQTYNMFSNMAFVLGAVFLWIVAQWCVTSLMDGEGRITEIFTATCYSLRPYVVLNIIATILSRVLLQTEGDFYTVLTVIALLWVGMLLVTSIMQTHNYSLGKTIWVIVIVLVVILLIVFIGMLVMALIQQVYAFVKDLITEATMRL